MTTTTLPKTTTPRIDPVGCDRCSAAGQVRWRLRNRLDLVLCGHHSNQHATTLITSGAFSVEYRVPDPSGEIPRNV